MLTMVACGPKRAEYMPRPGSYSELDSRAYDFLLYAQAIIAEGRAQFIAGQLPPSSEAYIDESIRLYNAARASWRTYRAILATGQPEAQANPWILQEHLEGLSRAIVELLRVTDALDADVQPMGV